MDRVLAFGCHPDDVEFMSAGTLALLAKQGFEIHIATMAGGEVGTPDQTPQAIRARRTGEAAAAAALLKAHYHYAGGYDLEIEYSAFYRKAATRIVREVDPLIVLTNPPMDYLADHEQTSLLVRNATYIASCPQYDCGVPTTPTKRFPYLYYWHASGLTDIFGRPLPVQFGIDVTGEMEMKTRMLVCHASQRDWLLYHNKWDAYTETMKSWTKKQGALIGREFGECFIQHLSNGNPTDNILKKILAPHYVELQRPAGYP